MSNLLQQQITDNFLFKNNITTNDVAGDTSDKSVHLQSVAQHLHDTRVHAQLSLADIANTLRISQHYLQAIEDCNLDVLPERVYTLGFIRSYAKHLGLNGEEIVKRFKNEILGEEILNTTYVATKLTEESSLPSRTLIYAITALLVLGAVGSWLYSHVFSTLDSQPTPMPAIIKSEIDQSLMMETLPTMAVSQNATATSSTTELSKEPGSENLSLTSERAAEITTAATVTQPSAVAANTITLSFTELTWIEIKDARGKILISENYKPGEIYTIELQDGMRFSTGNAGGITINRSGQTDFIMGKHGEIIKNIGFDSPRFKKL